MFSNQADNKHPMLIVDQPVTDRHISLKPKEDESKDESSTDNEKKNYYFHGGSLGTLNQ